MIQLQTWDLWIIDPRFALFTSLILSGLSAIDRSRATQDMIRKRTTKVFELLHPDIEDGVFICEAGTEHMASTEFANVSVSQTLGKFFKCRLRWAFAGHNNRPVWWSYGSRGVLETQFASIDTQDPSDLFSQVALEDHCVGDATHAPHSSVTNTLMTSCNQTYIRKSVTLLYKSLPKTATSVLTGLARLSRGSFVVYRR